MSLWSRSTLLTQFYAATICFMAASSAQADCGPVVAAFRKADSAKRFAWFKVTDPNQAPGGDPVMVTIGDISYVPVSGSKFKGKYQETGMLTGVLADSLAGSEQDGKAACKPLAERTLRGEPAVGFTVTGGVAITDGDPASEDVWISRGTGLPILQGMDSASRGGVVWVYGAAAAAPPPDKLVK